jgi:hypothetical protein
LDNRKIILIFVKTKTNTMEVLSIKKYNQRQTEKWERDYEKAKAEGRNWGCMPQLAFYIFNKNYGYVAFGERTALWKKTKKEVIECWEKEVLNRKIRGY